MIRWARNTLAVSGLMIATAVGLFLLASIISEAVLRHYWSGDDDWLWLMLPLGGAIGLVIGLQYQDRLWLQLLSGALCLGLVALLAWVWIDIKSQPAGLATGITILIAVGVTQVVILTTASCLSVAIIANAAIAWLRRGKHQSEGQQTTG